jgi:hypothetical protein
MGSENPHEGSVDWVVFAPEFQDDDEAPIPFQEFLEGSERSDQIDFGRQLVEQDFPRESPGRVRYPYPVPHIVEVYRSREEFDARLDGEPSNACNPVRNQEEEYPGEMTLTEGDKKDTGNYRVIFHEKGRSTIHEDEPQYGVIGIVYTGEYAGGTEIEIMYELDDDDELSQLFVDWDALRGDFDVADLLAQYGYDQYGNVRD